MRPPPPPLLLRLCLHLLLLLLPGELSGQCGADDGQELKLRSLDGTHAEEAVQKLDRMLVRNREKWGIKNFKLLGTENLKSTYVYTHTHTNTKKSFRYFS